MRGTNARVGRDAGGPLVVTGVRRLSTGCGLAGHGITGAASRTFTDVGTVGVVGAERGDLASAPSEAMRAGGGGRRRRNEERLDALPAETTWWGPRALRLLGEGDRIERGWEGR